MALPPQPQGTLSRRSWLSLAARGAAAAALSPLVAGGQQAAGRRPNVILILADDLASVDLNCYGATDLITPNLDALAARGARFTQFYVTAPACTASRASLLTGRHHPRLLHFGLGMEAEEVTLAEQLRSVGYRTGIFGKWHLGNPPEVSPPAQGFDRFVGFKVGVIDSWSHYYYWGPGARRDLWRDDKPAIEDGTYFPDLVNREAIDFIRQSGDRPFFLYLPYNLPHYPLQPPAAVLAKYSGVRDQARRYYAACVTALDERIGQVLGAVEQQGLTRDTIVIFLSDHGHSTEKDAMGGGGRAGPFRGNKGTLWEGGIRVPCIAAWPGHIPAGAVRQQPAMSLDWFPTLAQWCRAPLTGLEVDGVSLDGVLSSAQAPPPHPVLFWVWDKTLAVREGPWKLIVSGPTNANLSNLDTDPGEATNLADRRQDLVRRLDDLRQKWFAELMKDPTVQRWYGDK